MSITLKIGSRCIQVDKVVLSKFSDYFEAMFTSPFTEQTRDEITLQNVNYNSVKVIIDYMYSGSLSLSPRNIEDVYLTADFLQIVTVRRRSLEMLVKHLDHGNCVSLHRIASEHNLEMAEHHSFKMILKCFEEIFEDSEFLDFSCHMLLRVLSDYDLNISHEITVFRTIIQWTYHDKRNRVSFFEDLLSCLLVEHLSRSELSEVFQNELFRLFPDLKTMLRSRIPHNVGDIKGRIASCAGVTRERVGMILNRVYIIGGLADMAGGSDIEVYIPNTSSTQNLAGPFIPLDDNITSGYSNALSGYGGGCAVVDSVVYLTGGRTNSGKQDKIYKIHLHSHTIQEVGKMPVWADHVCVTCSDRKIFVVGGLTDISGTLTPTGAVQIFDTRTEEWSPGPSLRTGRAHAAIIGLDGGGGLSSRVIVLGGYGTKKLNSVEVIVDYEKVEELAPMLRERHAFCAAFYKGAIIAVGGWNEDSVERYDFRTKQWSLLSRFKKHRDCLQGIVCNEELFIIGGVNHNTNVSSIQRYNDVTHTWETVGHVTRPRLYGAIAAT